MITVTNAHAGAKVGAIAPGIVAAYIGRQNIAYGFAASPLANPYKLAKDTKENREAVIHAYRGWLDGGIHAHDRPVIDTLNELWAVSQVGDLRLVCWCSPLKCHGDYIKEILDAMVTPL